MLFAKLSDDVHLIPFSEIAVKYLKQRGFEAIECGTEEEARELALTLPKQRKWPCLFTASDTTGEKVFEEFYTEGETIDLERFQNLGIIKNDFNLDEEKLMYFEGEIARMKYQKSWTKKEIVELFHSMIPNFGHEEKGKFLDSKM